MKNHSASFARIASTPFFLILFSFTYCSELLSFFFNTIHYTLCYLWKFYQTCRLESLFLWLDFATQPDYLWLDLDSDKMTCDLTWLGLARNDLLVVTNASQLNVRTKWLVTWLTTRSEWLVTWLGLELNDLWLDLDLSKMTCDLTWTCKKWLVTNSV